MKLTFLLSLLFAFATSAHAQTTLPEAFQKKLSEAKITFTPPAGAEPVPVEKNEFAQYDYAFKLKGKDVEIRYSIWPLAQEIYDTYDKRQKKEGDSILDPRIFYKTVSHYMFNRIAGNEVKNVKPVQLQPLSQPGLKKDFGADAGGMFMGPVGPGYAKDYKHGFFMVFHKDHAADFYVVYLFKDIDAMFKEQQIITNDAAIFKAIRFNE